MSTGVFTVKGQRFIWRNNARSGKLDLYDADGNHIGVGPTVKALKRFVRSQSQLTDGGAK